MLGVGRNLQAPCLKPDQLLNRSRIARLFAQKNIWLKPVENIQLIDQCLTQITSKYLHELSIWCQLFGQQLPSNMLKSGGVLIKVTSENCPILRKILQPWVPEYYRRLYLQIVRYMHPTLIAVILTNSCYTVIPYTYTNFSNLKSQSV